MAWYWWTLLYVTGALITFRIYYLGELDDHQRAVHEYKTARRYDRPLTSTQIEVNWKFARVGIGLASVGWPIAAVIVLVQLVGKAVFWLLFPRGVKTKFDREQQLEREKKEAQLKYQEAKALLQREGIKVE